jgi:hypothetical protein
MRGKRRDLNATRPEDCHICEEREIPPTSVVQLARLYALRVPCLWPFRLARSRLKKDVRSFTVRLTLAIWLVLVWRGVDVM